MSQLQDFPIGFAEQINNNDQQDAPVFYVEWFDNASEFPGLASATTKSDLQGGNWELLHRKETAMDDDEHTIHPLKEDASWSNLNTKHSEKPYAKVAEEASELGPCQRKVKPLWSTKIKSNKKEQKDLVIVDEDDYDDLYYDHKYQSRRSNHLRKRQNIRNFKVVDMYIEGFFKVATSHAGKFTIVAQELEHNTYSSHVSNTRLNHKAAAIRYTSGFLGDPKPWMKTQNKRRTSILDVGEFSVFTPIVNEC